ncbi:MAG: winged helix-turn-helix transcriptional regulator [Clostridia bacterium]|nr:winged helix-turn-helix transcriptional regulator [Clostridia bacterium]
MELERFSKFTLLIDGIYKSIHKIKLDTAPYLGIKSVHVFWVYSLRTHPEGLTATELAALSEIDRSLVSREVAKLCADGYITNVGGSGKRRNYNSRLVLTEKGLELAEYIRKEALKIQNQADDGVSEEELESFYSVLEKLHANFVKITKEREENFIPPENNQ